MIGLWNYNMSTFLPILGVILTSISLLPLPTLGGVTKKIDKEFRQKIDSASTGSTWTVIIEFKKDEKIFESINKYVENLKVPDGEEHLKNYEGAIRLEKYANETQGKVSSAIRNFQRTHPLGKEVVQDTLWISNDLVVFRAPKELLYLLGEDETPEFENITEIIEDVPFPKDVSEEVVKPVKLPDPTRGDLEALFKPMKETWGLNKINAHAWWDAGFNGSGVIIGHIDDGVDCRHPSLKWNWVGKPYGWLDPRPDGSYNTFPWEADKTTSHGTHTLGILVGRGRKKEDRIKPLTADDVDFYGVGVAPGARWISCLGCDEIRCYPALLQKCGMFIHCPSMNSQCRYRPDVVSVSNGFRQNRTHKAGYKDAKGPYQRMINLFTSAGMIPVFAAGNNGRQGCQTINEPENLEIISVGNIDKDDTLRATSSMGPPMWRYNISYIKDRSIIKPDLVAPGTEIYSTVYAGRPVEFKFDYQTGTSQATPHVAGAIALLRSYNKDLTLDKVKAILFNHTVDPYYLKTTSSNSPCEGLDDQRKPNFKTGWGSLRLPGPRDLGTIELKRPSRKMPPPPDYSSLEENSALPKVRPRMVGVALMAGITFLMKRAIFEF